MDKIRLKLAIILATIFFTGNAFSQTTMKELIGLPIDSIGFNITMDSTDNRNIPTTSRSLQAITRISGNELHPHIPTSYTIDKTKDVGEIPCNSTVSPTGAMTINIPIEAYQSPDGFTPQISLTYNSLSGNGPLGWGWNIAGASVISKGNMSIYYDDQVYGVLTGLYANAYFIDGQRLIQTDISAGKVAYQTEQGFIKVRGIISGFDFNSFEVIFPDGRKAKYDITDGINYYITQMTDKSGSVINYTYTKINDHYRISKITYGKSKQAWLSFNYISRSADVQNIFNGGKKITYDYQLSSITTNLYGSAIRTYSLTYITGGSVSLISQIACTATGKSLNPLKFYYGDNKQIKGFDKKDTQLIHWYNFEEANQVRTTKGKFDYGSENDGIIMLPNKASYVEYYRKSGTFHHSRNYFENQYTGDETIIVATGLSGDFAMYNPELKTEAGFVDIFCMDLDKFDGEEIVKVNNYVSGDMDKIDFHVYTGNLLSGIAKKYTRSYSFNTLLDHRGTKSINPKYYYTGDFNGDGKMEVLVVSAYNAMDKGAPSKCYIIDLENNKILYEGSPFSYWLAFPAYQDKNISGEEAYAQSNKLYTIDYNGDGRTDLCLINDSGTTIFSFYGTGANINGYSTVATDSQLNNSMLRDREFLLGEFNGDGKSDFILSPLKSNGTTWSIFSSKGNGLWDEKDITITSRLETSKFILQDMNGDGQTDLIETYGSSSNVSLATYFISYQTYKGSSNTTIPKETVLIPTNIQSRNYYNNLISLKTGGIASRLYYKNDDSQNRLLTGIINSYGVITKADYQQLNDETTPLYTPGAGAEFPYQNFKGGLTVCSNLVAYNNGTLLRDLSYLYTNAVIHKQGLGFKRFEKINVYDNVTGKHSSQTFAPLRFSVLVEDDSDELSSKYTYSISTASNKITNILLTQKTTTDKSKGLSTTGQYKYDAYGNITQEIISYGNGLSTTKNNTYQNITKDSVYILGLPLTEQSITARNGGTSTNRTVMTYNTQYFPISKTYYVANTNKIKEEKFEYNSINQLIRTRTKYYSSPNEQIVGYEYNSNGQLSSQTDPLGLKETYTYNGKGLLSAVQNHKNKKTSFDYDPWGRKIKSTYADGSISTSTASWASSPTNALIVINESSTGQPDTQTYLDALNREVRTGEKCFDGQYLYVDNLYDNQGHLSKTSYPCKGTPGLWQIYSYDNYDRITKVVYPTGRQETYSYSGLTTTSVINGISTKQIYNAMGDLIKVEDSSGSITYNYRPDGQLSSIIAPGNITTSFSYDTYGRQTQLTDPSAGSTTFTYDAAGNTNSKTDANGKATRMTYDTYNRLTKLEYVGELTTNYAYNTDGLITSEQSNNGTSKTYMYDDLFRLSVEKEVIVDGKWLQKYYLYNNGNISSVNYLSQSGNITTEYFKYTNGNLSEIKLNDSISIWKLTGENNQGLPTAYTTGILSRTQTYDTDGRVTSIIAKKNTTSIQNFGCSFIATTGNLGWRSDAKRNLKENFGYDNLNRLTTFAKQTVAYDIKGNITNSSGIGKFEYSASKPYAIETVTASGNTIPLRNQTIAYNAMLRPVSITENGYTATFTYNGDANRVKMLLKQGTADKLTRYYIGNKYELDKTANSTKEKLYVGGDAYSAQTVLVKNGTGTWNIYYLCRDHLGSITQITDASGNIVQELSYDAWGKLRNPATQAIYAPGSEPELFLGRGYTGHEHLAIFGLINMNARLYDPALGRFLSPDPYVQNPDFSQNFNRYSYCLNNPLIYVDQNGEWFLIDDLIAAAIGGIFNVIVNAVQGNIHSVGQGFALFGTGAASGFVTIYAGPIAGAAVLGATNSIINQGFNNGWGNIDWMQVGSSGIMGGATSYLGGNLGSYLAKPISKLTEGIASPILKEVLTQGTLNATTGFGLGTAMALGSGADLGEALKQGSQSAALGLTSGVMNGLAKGIKSNKENANEQTETSNQNKERTSPKFSETAAQHQEEPARRVPLQILEEGINSTIGVPDPQGTRAMMHYTKMWKNGIEYKLEILYDKKSNTIWHFKYKR